MPPKTDTASWPWSLAWPLPAGQRLATLGAWVATGLILLVAPFERVDSPIALPGQTITNAEAATLVALAIWIGSSLVGRRLPAWRSPLAWPALALVAGVAVAAAAAPAEQANAFRTVGRIAAGLFVCLLAADAGRWRDGVPALMRIAVAAGGFVGVVALLEVLDVPIVVGWLAHFRESAHVVGGQLRATSTLQYPTITSMYLEVVFAMALGVLVLEIDRGRARAAGFVFVAAAIIAEGVVLTLTRAGLVTVALSLAIVAAGLIARRGLDRAARAVVALAFVVSILAGGTLGLRSSWLRFTTDGQEGWYRATFDAPVSLRLATGVMTRVPLTVRNDGRATWRTEADPSFRLSHHWLDAKGAQVVVFDGLRSAFPQDVPPGGQTTVDAWVQAPPVPGRYLIAWDIVLEKRLWFGTETPLTTLTAVEVSGDAVGTLPPPLPGMPLAEVRLGRLTLWGIALRMIAARPLAGFGPDNFRLLHGEFAGIDRADARVHTNNMYLELLVGAGLVGGLPLVWLLWRIVSAMGRAWPRVGRDALPVFLGLAAAVAAVLAHGLLDSFLTFTPTYLVIWTSFGLAAAWAASTGEPRADRV